MAGGSPIARVVGQINAANRGTPQGASYTPVEANVYSSPFTSQQAAPTPQMSPLAQQMMQRSMPVNPYGQGLQSIYSMFNRPQMPMYQNSALAYRPDMAAVQQNLSRVRPSVYRSELDAARARIAELEGQQSGGGE